MTTTDDKAAARSEREVDAKLAAKCLGWRWWRYRRRGEFIRSLQPPSFPDESLARSTWWIEAGGSLAHGDEPMHAVESTWDAMFVTPVPDFHTDASAMIQLIEGMRAKGWTVELVMPPSPNGISCSAEKGRRLAVESGDTPMRAVARAAAAAVEGEVRAMTPPAPCG